jgi:hypothetical protein
MPNPERNRPRHVLCFTNQPKEFPNPLKNRSRHSQLSKLLTCWNFYCALRAQPTSNGAPRAIAASGPGAVFQRFELRTQASAFRIQHTAAAVVVLCWWLLPVTGFTQVKTITTTTVATKAEPDQKAAEEKKAGEKKAAEEKKAGEKKAAEKKGDGEKVNEKKAAEEKKSAGKEGAGPPDPVKPAAAKRAVRAPIARRVLNGREQPEESPEKLAAARDPSPKTEAELAKLPAGKGDAGKAARDATVATTGLPLTEEEEDGFAQVPVADVNQFEQQFKRQFLGLVKAELFFLNHTCNSTSEQRKQLKISSEIILTQTVVKFAELQKKMNQGGFDWNAPHPDPRRHIQEAFAKDAKKCLTPEQVAIYEGELIKRLENRKRASVMNVVARLDEELILTAEQRTKLAAELTEKWKAAESQQMEIFLYGNNYFPNIPEQFITSSLTDKQKEVWRGIPKNNNIFFGIGHVGNVVINGDMWNDDLPEAKDAEVKNPNAANAGATQKVDKKDDENKTVDLESEVKADEEKEAGVKAAAVKAEADKAATVKAEAKAAAAKDAAQKAEASPKP